MSSRREQKEAARERRLAAERAAQRQESRARRLRLGSAAAIAAAAIVAVVLLASHHSSTAHGSTGRVIDGIQCQSQEQVLFHIHAHLAIYVNGKAQTIPEGIGIAPPRSVQQSNEGPFVVGGSCFYWLHSHTADGVIHIESPIRRTYTLGNYLDVWGQPLPKGRLTAYVDGKPYRGAPRAIPLRAHTRIQLDYGTRVALKPFTFPSGL